MRVIIDGNEGMEIELRGEVGSDNLEIKTEVTGFVEISLQDLKRAITAFEPTVFERLRR